MDTYVKNMNNVRNKAKVSFMCEMCNDDSSRILTCINMYGCIIFRYIYVECGMKCDIVIDGIAFLYQI